MNVWGHIPGVLYLCGSYVWLLSLKQPASSPGSCFMPEPMSLQLTREVGRSSNGPDRELSEVKTLEWVPGP